MSIDGGPDYFRYGYPVNFVEGKDFEKLEIEIDHSGEELFNDWNKRINKLGIIK